MPGSRGAASASGRRSRRRDAAEEAEQQEARGTRQRVPDVRPRAAARTRIRRPGSRRRVPAVREPVRDLRLAEVAAVALRPPPLVEALREHEPGGAVERDADAIARGAVAVTRVHDPSGRRRERARLARASAAARRYGRSVRPRTVTCWRPAGRRSRAPHCSAGSGYASSRSSIRPRARSAIAPSPPRTVRSPQRPCTAPARGIVDARDSGPLHRRRSRPPPAAPRGPRAETCARSTACGSRTVPSSLHRDGRSRHAAGRACARGPAARRAEAARRAAAT